MTNYHILIHKPTGHFINTVFHQNDVASFMGTWFHAQVHPNFYSVTFENLDAGVYPDLDPKHFEHLRGVVPVTDLDMTSLTVNCIYPRHLLHQVLAAYLDEADRLVLALSSGYTVKFTERLCARRPFIKVGNSWLEVKDYEPNVKDLIGCYVGVPCTEKFRLFKYGPHDEEYFVLGTNTADDHYETISFGSFIAKTRPQ